jgi:hypothetical protein
MRRENHNAISILSAISDVSAADTATDTTNEYAYFCQKRNGG